MAARWYTWALAVTSSGIVDTRSLATYFETSGYVHEASRDESPAAVGSLQASAAQRERERDCVASFNWQTRWTAGTGARQRRKQEADDAYGAPGQHRAFIESRAFSKLTIFEPQNSIVEDWAFKFENMAAAVVPSSRETLNWAAHQETPILTVDDVEAGPDSLEINPQVYVALAELLEGEPLDIVQITTRGAGLDAWRKLVRRFDP